jgi:hypothetical protein
MNDWRTMNWMQRAAGVIIYGIAGTVMAVFALAVLACMTIGWSDAPADLRWTWGILFGLIGIAGALSYFGNRRASTGDSDA